MAAWCRVCMSITTAKFYSRSCLIIASWLAYCSQSLISPNNGWTHYQLTSFHLNCDWSQPRRTGSYAVKRPSSPWLRPITAQSVQMEWGQLRLGRTTSGANEQSITERCTSLRGDSALSGSSAASTPLLTMMHSRMKLPQ